MSEYTVKADEFLSRHAITFKAKFVKHEIYFPTDKDSRDIFRLTLSRKVDGKLKRTSFLFGQSLNLSTGDGSNPPRPYDLLACLEKTEPDTFDNFIKEFGYEIKSAADFYSTRKVYNGVVRQYKQVKAFFTEAEITELYEIN